MAGLSNMTWSEDACSHAVSWIQDCRANHTHCRSPSADRSLPSRLIDLGPGSFGPDGLARFEDPEKLEGLERALVISTAKLDQKSTPYLALSHCWGGTPPLLLNKSTLPDLTTAGISRETLKSDEARVLRHAISVTKSLGFQYLWVDCLCIQQDHAADRTDEIMQMNHVYSNAEVVLSASGASKWSDGMIINRELTDMFVLLKFEQELAFLSPTVFWGELPLQSRGWAFQEHLLARRVLHFNTHQVIWECLSDTSGDGCDFPYWADACSFERSWDEIRTMKDDSPEPTLRKSFGLRQIPDEETASSLWKLVVRNYSKTQVTYANDRLTALSAVSKTFGEIAHLEPHSYMAGMWSAYLPDHLLWYASTSTPKHPVRYRAPTWSWASVASIQVEWRNVPDCEVRNYSCTVERAWVELKSKDIYGEVVGGGLRIKCPLCKMIRTPRGGNGRHTWIWDEHSTGLEELFTPYTFGPHEPKANEIRVFWDDDLSASQTAAAIYLASVKVLEKVHDNYYGPRDVMIVQGLILRREEDMGTYKRTGLWEVTTPKSPLSPSLDGILAGIPLDPEAREFIQDLGDGRYLIDIV